MSDEQYARTGRFMFLLVWIIIFIALFLFFNYQGTQKSQVLLANQNELVLTADAQGHYFVAGTINDHPVEFLIDTGASIVAIPQNVADALHIKGSYPITLSTANGHVTGALTRVQRLSFGAFTLNNVKVVIIPADKNGLVLLGMNVLHYFDLSQNNKQLVLKRQSQE